MCKYFCSLSVYIIVWIDMDNMQYWRVINHSSIVGALFVCLFVSSSRINRKD